jgi:hypothetical protein
MNRPLLRAAACTLAAVAATVALLAVPASSPSQAASLNINDPNCDSFTLTGTAPNQVLNCVVSNPPTCTVTGSNTAQISTNLTLTASCSPAATSYVWTGCTSTASTCQDNQSSSGNVTYTVKGSNANGAGPVSPDFVVNWSNTVVAPGGCSISGGGTVTAGASVTLQMTCTSGTGLSYAWTGGFAQGATTATVTGTVNSSTSFSATASNSGGSITKNASVTVGGGGGGGGNITCTNVSGATHVINATWGTSLYYTADAGGFGPNDIVVVKFTTSAISSSTSKGYAQAVEYSDPPSGRTAALSDTPCSLVGLPLVGGGTSAFGPNDNAPWAHFSLVASKLGASILQPSTTYYLNIVNSANSTCRSTGSCNMLISFSKPSGS